MPTSELSIHPALLTDIELIRTLADSAFRVTYRELLCPEQLEYMLDWMYSTEELHKQLCDGRGWFVAYLGEQPCGYLAVNRVAEGVFHLDKIYVLPTYQGKGVGEALFNKAVEYVRAAHTGKSRMELNVNRQNRAVAFYERMGMHRAGEGDFEIGQGYYMNDYIYAIEIE